MSSIPRFRLSPKARAIPPRRQCWPRSTRWESRPESTPKRCRRSPITSAACAPNTGNSKALSLRVDPQVLKHHVPGGMISNLTSQCASKTRSIESAMCWPRFRGRADLGYPPLVTPMSQMVGAQAALNVFAGERYAHVSQEVKQYLRGAYGRVPGRNRSRRARESARRRARRRSRQNPRRIRYGKTRGGNRRPNQRRRGCFDLRDVSDIGKTFLQERAAR